MTVPAVRFESLSRDFNLPQTSFQSIRDSEILNAPLDLSKKVWNLLKVFLAS